MAVAETSISPWTVTSTAVPKEFEAAPSAVSVPWPPIWAWALAVPASSKNAVAAQKFVNWATSKSYIALVAKEEGWAHVPTGTRKVST